VDTPITTVTITRNPSGEYHVSLRMRQDIPELPPVLQMTGIDLNLDAIVVTAQGVTFPNPRHLRRHERRLKRADRAYARKQRGSKNQEKARVARARAHAKVRNARRDHHQKMTTTLVRDNQVLVVEGLNILGMLQNHRLAKAISDAAWGAITRMLQYKCAWYGRTYLCLDRWIPTTTPCSTPGCTFQHDGPLDLKIRSWTCPACDTTHDRDVNAARNMLAAGHAVLLAERQQRACGAPHTPAPARTAPRPGGDEAGRSVCENGSPLL